MVTLLATGLPTLLAAALAGVLALLAWLLATALLLPGLLLAALLALVRVLRILAHRFLPWAQSRTPNPRQAQSFRTAT